MSTNSTTTPLTGSDEGFARRRMNDLAGLAAIVSTMFLVSLLTGTDSPIFAVAVMGALGALVYGEQRLRATSGTASAAARAPLARRHASV